MRRSASFGRVRSPSNCRRNKSILARQLRATKTDIGHTPILSNETVSYYIHNMWRRIFHGLAIVAAVVSLFGSAPGFASPGRSPVSWCPYQQQFSHDPVVAAFRADSGRIRLNTILLLSCCAPQARTPSDGSSMPRRSTAGRADGLLYGRRAQPFRRTGDSREATSRSKDSTACYSRADGSFEIELI